MSILLAHPNFRGKNVKILFDQVFNPHLTQVTTEESTVNTTEWSGTCIQYTFNWSNLIRGKRVSFPEVSGGASSFDSTKIDGQLGLYVVGTGGFIYQLPYINGIMRLTYKDP